MTTTLSGMVDRISLSLEGSTGPPELDIMNGLINSFVTAFTATTALKAYRVGAIVQIEDELMRITSVSGLTINVIRGVFGSTAASHDDGAPVYFNPRHSRAAIYQNMKEEINSWPRTIFRVAEYQITVSPTADVMTYAVFTTTAAADLYIRKLRLLAHAPTSTSERWITPRRAKIMTDMPAADFTSTMCLQLAGKVPNVTQYDLTYAQKFDTATAWAATTDIQDDIGVPLEMEDIIEYGTMGRLLIGKESRRVQRNQQGQPREAQQVREGSIFQTAAGYTALSKSRISEEAGRLAEQWPLTMN